MKYMFLAENVKSGTTFAHCLYNIKKVIRLPFLKSFLLFLVTETKNSGTIPVIFELIVPLSAFVFRPTPTQLFVNCYPEHCNILLPRACNLVIEPV